jgi:hypothetical protein
MIVVIVIDLRIAPVIDIEIVLSCDRHMVMRDRVEEPDGPIYWPCWPFRRRTSSVMRVKGGFKISVYQRELHESHARVALTADAVELQGYVSTDRKDVTTTVDFKNGSRLKRHTRGAW